MFFQYLARHRHIVLVIALASFLYLTYLLTLTGVRRSEDELLMTDATESLAIHGNMDVSESIRYNGLTGANVEPLQPFLAAPLYRAVHDTAWIGNIHGLYLFTPIITAILCALFYTFAIQQGYREQSALIASLLLGLTTILWPYTQTFFRESLAALTVLAAVIALDRWRRLLVQGASQHVRWLVIEIATVILALISKETILLLIPWMLMYAYPGNAQIARHGRSILFGLLAVTLAGGAILALFSYFRGSSGFLYNRYLLEQDVPRLIMGLGNAWPGLTGFLISPAKGIWWFSPILLSGFSAPILLPRERWREAWLPLWMTLWYALCYSALLGETWFGGAGWGARFMIPIVPLLMISALPAIDWMISSTRFSSRLLLWGLVFVGLCVQAIGLYVNLYAYYAEIEAQTGQYVWSDLATWNPRWSQIIGGLLFITRSPTNLLWLTPTPDWLAILLMIMGIGGSGWVLCRTYRYRDSLRPDILLTTLLTPFAALLLTLFVLSRAYDDPRYLANTPALDQLRQYLQDHATQKDAILLGTSSYHDYFLNYYKGQAPWYGLPTSPGERISPEQPPLVISSRVEDLISDKLPQALNAIMIGGPRYHQEHVWLVMDSSPFHTWSLRPPEWYLAKYSYPVSVQEFSATVRLIEYLPLLSPLPNDPPATRLSIKFGNSINLRGYDLASNVTLDNLSPGDMLGISLVWAGRKAIDLDYTVAIFLVDPSGVVIAQQDRQPVGGFAPTSHWQPGSVIRDNYGFYLPESSSSGQYQIWVVVYQWPSLDRLPITGDPRHNAGDHVLLATFEVK
jgi:hypothetical protein